MLYMLFLCAETGNLESSSPLRSSQLVKGQNSARICLLIVSNERSRMRSIVNSKRMSGCSMVSI